LVYNDLKLDNLVLDYNTDVETLKSRDYTLFDGHNLNIVDFGFATPYLEQDG